jgi:hypothetical protein
MFQTRATTRPETPHERPRVVVLMPQGAYLVTEVSLAIGTRSRDFSRHRPVTRTDGAVHPWHRAQRATQGPVVEATAGMNLALRGSVSGRGRVGLGLFVLMILECECSVPHASDAVGNCAKDERC